VSPFCDLQGFLRGGKLSGPRDDRDGTRRELQVYEEAAGPVVNSRLCETPGCNQTIEPRPATHGKRFDERIELSTGRVPTVVWDCTCGYRRFEVAREPVAAD
jgi:hypothetical protein